MMHLDTVSPALKRHSCNLGLCFHAFGNLQEADLKIIGAVKAYIYMAFILRLQYEYELN